MTGRFIFTATIIIIFFSSFSQNKKINSGEEVLRKMYTTYKGHWYKDFTFTQTTKNYRNDSLVKTATWYEAIVFPDKFRISFGEKEDGNAMIQRGDSAFNFRKGKLFKRSLKGEDLTFLLGGMYFIPFDSVKVRIKYEGYDITRFHEDKWKGKTAYVIGTVNAGERGNQLWIDKAKLVVIRFVKYDGETKEEAVFGDHKKFGKAWSETSCLFYRNDKLLQQEAYYNCQANRGVDMTIFDPYNFK